MAKEMTHEQRLETRRHQLKRLLEMNASDIIVHHQMRMVQRSQKAVHGRGWYRPRGWFFSLIASWVRYNLLKGN